MEDGMVGMLRNFGWRWWYGVEAERGRDEDVSSVFVLRHLKIVGLGTFLEHLGNDDMGLSGFPMNLCQSCDDIILHDRRMTIRWKANEESSLRLGLRFMGLHREE
ncbi:hypothetical protein L6452_21889 [Arctium lappa]|uniref:Uncharacterized protein n=1 Tax=Arctium lappa TaxID=4217 RepID=A0ACB9AYJ1_ARCLA|nr:hypothetical protein L6452_21889 [Arctium lappa]